MQKNQRYPIDLSLIALICISLFGLALVTAFITFLDGKPDGFELRKPLIGSIFSVLCIMGIIASIYPSSCSSVFSHERNPKHNETEEKLHPPPLQGHHPTCGNYTAHILKINSRVLCATCTGFSFGAIIALIGTSLFFFGPFSFGTKPIIPLIIGAIGVTLGMLHPILPFFKIGFSRFAASAYFAVGAFLILASVENALQDTFIDFYVVLLSALWLVTDTAFSKWDHRRICAKCSSDSCGKKKN